MERLSAITSALLGLLVLIGIVLGPLVLDRVQFHMNRNSIVQYQGSEVVMLVVTLGLFVAAWMWNTDNRLAAVISPGLALFVIYTMVTVVMGQEYEQFPEGNAEKFFLLYAAITALAVVLVLLSLNATMEMTLHVSSRWISVTKWTLGLAAGLFALLWLAQIAAIYRDGLTAELAETRLLFWLVKYLDLGFLIPATFITIALLHYGQPLASMLVVSLSGFIVLMLVAIASMTISSRIHNEPEGVLLLAVGMVVLAIPVALVWWQWARSVRG